MHDKQSLQKYGGHFLGKHKKMQGCPPGAPNIYLSQSLMSYTTKRSIYELPQNFKKYVKGNKNNLLPHIQMNCCEKLRENADPFTYQLLGYLIRQRLYETQHLLIMWVLHTALTLFCFCSEVNVCHSCMS